MNDATTLLLLLAYSVCIKILPLTQEAEEIFYYVKSMWTTVSAMKRYMCSLYYYTNDVYMYSTVMHVQLVHIHILLVVVHVYVQRTYGVNSENKETRIL